MSWSYVTKLLKQSCPDLGRERIAQMSNYNQRAFGSDIYTLIRAARMTEAERDSAVKAMHDAEAIADAILWVRNKLAALGNFFLHPSLKH